MRELFRRVHFTFGLILALPFAVLGITGSYLALGEPGNGAVPAQAPLHATAHTRKHAPKIGELVSAAQAAAPDGARPLQYVAGTRGAPARISFSAGPARRTLQVFVDPATLKATPAGPRSTTLYSFVHDLHANVFAGATGRQIVGWLGAATLLLVLTGPIAWWPGRRQLREAFVVKRNASGFRFFRDVHRAAGIWAFSLLLLLSVTGTYIVFPEPVGRTIAAIFPARALWSSSVAGIRRDPDAEPLSPDDAVTIARTAAGGSRVRSVAFARSAQPWRIELASEQPGGDPIVVLIDPFTHRVADIRDPQTYTLGERIIAALRPLHEGHILGVAWHAVLFVVGLCPLFFAVTGVTMWLLKRRRAVPSPRASGG